MTTRSVRTARRGAATLRRRIRAAREPFGIILMYHRVADEEFDPWELCVSPDHFAAQIRLIRENMEVVPLAQLTAAVQASTGDRPVVSITFDDGYVDNLTIAKPILAKYEVPATVFLVTEAIAMGIGFWWDALAAAVLRPSTLPPNLEIDVEENHFRYSNSLLGARGETGFRARRELLDGLWRWLSAMPAAGRHVALNALLEGLDLNEWPAATGRPMTASEVRELVSDPRLEIGGHSVSHPRLTALPQAEQRTEVDQCRNVCRQVTGNEPCAFAFPNGDLDETTVEIVKQCGFELACTSQQELVWSSTDSFRLPRIPVGDYPGERLMRRLQNGWFH